MARRAGDADFGGDRLRLGFNSDTPEAWDRTPGRKTQAVAPGARSACHTEQGRKTYEIALPLHLLKDLKASEGSHLVMDLAFASPEDGSEPNANSFSYRIRYGSDSLVPVHFVELDLQGKP